ncbi:MAG: primosomal protein N' [Ancalomicrobiaceae bacterium]|nr:primosomal protein N' [Ancalomicrobiaceae bacterium]
MSDLFGNSRRVVSVLVPVAIDTAYSYKLPRDMEVAPGSIVVVPLGPRKVIGVVWDEAAGGETVGDNRLREIEHAFPAPPLGPSLRRFVDWVGSYYLMPRGMVMRMVIRSPEALEPEARIRGIRHSGPAPERLTDARKRVLELTADGAGWSRSGLAASAAVSSGVIDGLIAQGTLEEVWLEPGRAIAAPDPDFAPPTLSAEQQDAAVALRAAASERGFSVTLLDGVTGSGKTEVYFEAVAETLRQGRQAAILLPEIALTGEFLDRFAERFGARPAEWHSQVSPKARAQVWRGVVNGEIKAVVGARSALFLPFADLGLIVVDEEHDGAYKQDEGVNYHARDMAVVRGRLGGFPVVLSSATPSIESRVNADQGRYRRLILEKRARGAVLPDIEAIDLRRHLPARGRFLSPPLVQALRDTLKRGEQALLFLNRRGYAPLTLCRTCGHRFQCPECSTWLVEHRFRGVLTCHHCGHTMRRPDHCPECGEVDSLIACGPGIERIAEEVADEFPDAHRMILSSDLPGGVQRMKEELAAVARGEADIVIGTQLVAKGHNFPKLTLVGVVDADLGLAHGDPRAAEKTFQLLQQVTGRAGRAARSTDDERRAARSTDDGHRAARPTDDERRAARSTDDENGYAGGAARGLLQTYAPGHPVIRAIVAGDREGFYAHEIEERRVVGLPPFGRLAGIVVSADDREQAASLAQALGRSAPSADRVIVLGPTEAPLAVIRGRHRFRLLVKSDRSVDLQAYVKRWFAASPPPRGSQRVSVDIDPQSFL